VAAVVDVVVRTVSAQMLDVVADIVVVVADVPVVLLGLPLSPSPCHRYSIG